MPATLTLNGWGRTTPALCQARRPERATEALADFTAEGALCLHGAGRSYGDCAVLPGGRALITTRLDRILDFDTETGIVQVEPGVDFARLLSVFLPRGFLVPVTPGTGFATIGGAVANDVHGKNHEHAGSFGQYVRELDLALPDGSQRTITPADDALFRATCGGLGLTGMITRIAFRLERVPGGSVSMRDQRVPDLAAFIAAMEGARDAAYTVGWIDGTARGRGTRTRYSANRGNHPWRACAAAAAPPRRTGRFSFHRPQSRDRATVQRGIFPPRTSARSRLGTGPGALSLSARCHPWLEPHLRRARGFYQFQCVVPFGSGEPALREMLDIIAASRQASFLAVLKRMGAGRAGYLSFPMAGYTLALDFPRGQGVEALYARLCTIARAAGGRVYLGKDALLSAGDFRAMYPEFSAFRDVLEKVDPQARMQSAMAERLRLRERE